MAGRFLPQRDVNLVTRVTRELVGDKQNNKDGLINQECVIYKPSLQESVTNMYGEAAGGKKIYKNGVQMNALIDAEDFDFNTDEFGPDLRQSATFSFERDYLVGLPLVTSIGDVIDWYYAHWEIASLNENQLVGGQVDSNFSVVCSTFLVRKSNLQIERIRSN